MSHYNPAYSEEIGVNLPTTEDPSSGTAPSEIPIKVVTQIIDISVFDKNYAETDIFESGATFIITGKLVDVNGNGIPGRQVALKPATLNVSALTGELGIFEISGYITESMNVTVSFYGGTTYLPSDSRSIYLHVGEKTDMDYNVNKAKTGAINTVTGKLFDTINSKYILIGIGIVAGIAVGYVLYAGRKK